MDPISRLQKTIIFDRRIREGSIILGALSAGAVCYDPIVFVPSTIASTIVFSVAEWRLQKNNKKLELLNNSSNNFR